MAKIPKCGSSLVKFLAHYKIVGLYFYLLLNVIFCVLKASDLAPMSIVFTRKSHERF